MSSTAVFFDIIGRDRGGSDAFQKVADSADSTSGAMSKFGGMAKSAVGGLAVGAFGALAGAAATAGAAILSAMDQEKSSDRLAASLGATPAVAEKYGKVASSLYAGAWGDSMDDVNRAVEAVASSFQGLGKKGDLERVTAQALDFASIFEIDLPRATSVASTVISSGLAKDATEAFDLMTAAAQRVPSALREDVMDAAEEYSQFFDTLGFSGPQAFGILAEGAKKGMYGIDKAGDAIKEFTIRSTDMSKASIQAYNAIGLDYEKMTGSILAGGPKSNKAFNQILDGILGIKNPAEQSAAAIALFGTPLEDLNVKDIPAFLKSLKSGTKGMKDWKGSIDDAGKTLNDNAATNFESFKRQIKQGFVELVGGKALPILSKFAKIAVAEVGPAMQKLGAWIRGTVIPAFKQFATDVIPVVKQVMSSVIEAFNNVKGDLVAVWGDVKSIFLDGVAIVRALWRVFGDDLLTHAREKFQAIVQVIRGVFQVVSGVFKVFASALKGDWRGVWDGLKKIFKGFGNIFMGLVKSLWSTAKLAFKAAGIALKGIFGLMWDGIKALAKKGADWLKGKFQEIPAAIKNLAGRYRDAGGWIMSKLWEIVKEKASDGARFIVDKIREIPGKIKDLAGKFREAGGALIGGIADGIRNAGGFASDFAGEIWAAVRSAINSGIASLNNLLEFSIKVGPKTFTVNPPDIGYLARGTDNWRGGLAVVGEEGPELVSLPRGSRVTPHGESMGALRGLPAAGGSAEPIVVQVYLDGQMVEQSLIRRNKTTGRPLQFKATS